MYAHTHWVVRKIRADFERKLKCRFKFLISFIKFKSFELSGQPNMYK